MSFLRYMTIKSFSFYNPDWVINIVHNNKRANNTWISSEEQDNVNYKGHDFREELSGIPNLILVPLDSIFLIDYSTMSNIHIKDILNWYLLSIKSCVVADMDIIFCQPINKSEGIDWNSHINLCNFDFFSNYIPVSFMASDVMDDNKNKFFDEVYQNSVRNYNPRIYESCGTKSITYPSIYVISEHFKDLKVNKMDHMIVFPFTSPNPNNATPMCWLKDNSHLFTSNTIGVHWYGGNPMSQIHNNKITKDNFQNFNNTITNIIKKII